MLACHKKDLAKSLPREMLPFGHYFIDGKCDAKDRIIPRETAILTIVDAFVGKIERCKQPHGSPKILQCERAGSLRHRFEFLIGFQSNQMLKTLDQFRFSQSKTVQCLDKRHQDNFVCMVSFANLTRTKKRRPVFPDAAVANALVKSLEGEIHASADHTKIIFWAIHEIPAEITDPADVRSYADFHSTANLADCPRLSICMTSCRNDIETFSRLDKALVDLLLATAKDPASPAKNVGRKARAGDRVTQGKSAQYSTDRVALAVDTIGKNSVAEIDEGILARLPSINHPALNPDANVTHEKIFEVNATPQSVISLDVAVINPISSRENVCAPKRDVEFPVRVPLRTGGWSNLLDFLA